MSIMPKLAVVLLSTGLLVSAAQAQTMSPAELDRLSAQRQAEIGPRDWGAPVAVEQNYKGANLPLDGETLALLYDKISGVEPDFEKYAEHTRVYQDATTFDQQSVLQKQEILLKDRYEKLGVKNVFTSRIGVQLLQYDTEEKAYTVDFGESSYIPMTDPVAVTNYGIQFRNRAAIAKIPMSLEKAEKFAKQFNLSTAHDISAGDVILELSYHIDSVPPTLDETGPRMVNADIVAARILTRTGHQMYEFIIDASPLPEISTMLKTSDIQNIKLGQSDAAALAAVSTNYPKQLGNPVGDGKVFLFKDLSDDSKNRSQPYVTANAKGPAEWAACAGQEYGSQSFDSHMRGEPAPTFERCMVLFRKNGIITRIISDQTLTDNVQNANLRQRLDEKYGTPTSVENNGDVRIWVGRDPAGTSSGQVKITAEIVGMTPNRSLILTAEPYENISHHDMKPAETSAPIL